MIGRLFASLLLAVVSGLFLRSKLEFPRYPRIRRM